MKMSDLLYIIYVYLIYVFKEERFSLFTHFTLRTQRVRLFQRLVITIPRVSIQLKVRASSRSQRVFSDTITNREHVGSEKPRFHATRTSLASASATPISEPGERKNVGWEQKKKVYKKGERKR